LILGLGGAAFALFFQLWASAVSWPINVGGRPWNSLPAFVPIAFESAVLFAGLGTVFAFLWLSRLWPGRKTAGLADGVTNDSFVIRDEEKASGGGRSWRWRPHFPRTAPANAVVLCLLIITGTAVMLRFEASRLGIELFADMVHTAGYKSLSPNSQFADGKTVQLPPENTIPRGVQASGGAPGDENPFSPADENAAARGAQVFSSFCVPCHGITGDGNGIVARLGFPQTASLVSEPVIEMTDGQIFSVITYGSGEMPGHGGQIDRPDRWKAVLYIRRLQSGRRQAK
jgi:mono/diheme cytochrome c family protein